MKKVLVAYYSSTGRTKQMAELIAEGVRIAGHEAEAVNISQLKEKNDLIGYDGYIFGCPTYHLDMPESFKEFLSMAEAAGLEGKVGGAFDCRTHPSSAEGSAAGLIFDMMESKFQMRMTNLGPFDLKPDWLEAKGETVESSEGSHACHVYGKAVGEMLAET
jgi:flavodoxin